MDSLSIQKITPQSPLYAYALRWFLSIYPAMIQEEINATPMRGTRRYNPQKESDLRHFLEQLLIAEEESCLLVVYHQKKPMGYFLGYLKHCIAETPEKVGYINGIYVLPEYRGQGIGQKLYAEGVRWFHERGIQCLELYVATGNHSGKEFWRRHGFTLSEEVMVGKVVEP